MLVTHKFESLKYVDYIYIFEKGQIVQAGTLEELQNSEAFQEIQKKYTLAKNSTEIKEAAIEEEKKVEEKPQDLLIAPEIQDKEVSQEEKPVAGEEEKGLLEKLMLEEDKEVGDLGFHVWKSAFRYYGGWCYFVPFLLSKKLRWCNLILD